MKVIIPKRDKDALEYAAEQMQYCLFTDHGLKVMADKGEMRINRKTLDESKEVLQALKLGIETTSPESIQAWDDTKEERARRTQAYMRLSGLYQKIYKAIRQAEGSRL